MTDKVTEVKEKNESYLTRYEKRFPKDLYEIKEDDKEIVVVPKNPNVLHETRRLLIAEGIDEKEVDRLFELRPVQLGRYFRKRSRPRTMDEWLAYFFE